LEFFAVFPNFKIFMYSKISHGTHKDVLWNPHWEPFNMMMKNNCVPSEKRPAPWGACNRPTRNTLKKKLVGKN
jgi:hypothetical protein